MSPPHGFQSTMSLLFQLRLSPRCSCLPTVAVSLLPLSPRCGSPPAAAVPPHCQQDHSAGHPVFTPALAGGEVSGSQSLAWLCPPTCMQRVCQGMKDTV